MWDEGRGGVWGEGRVEQYGMRSERRGVWVESGKGCGRSRVCIGNEK